MKKVISVWKDKGETPLQCITRIKLRNSIYANETISYAGRLDPMAEGALLLLVGHENKNRKNYENLNKVYESEIIFGISTDSFDSLGLINKVKITDLAREEIEKALKRFVGPQKQIYPPYSSKTVHGKPLFWWTREKKLSEIVLPEREIEIYELNLLSYDFISSVKISEDIIKCIKKVEGDFRQEIIIKGWEDFELKNKNKQFLKIKIKISCSSGTYVRRLASDMGDMLKSGAFAYSIKRKSIGNYAISLINK